jgi:large subunit ribosomal protein L17
MRHGKKINHLSRKSAHRKAMLSNMASSLVKHKKINTTLAKAKALRIFIEPLITKAKSDTTHSRRTVFKYLKDKYAVTELFRDVAPKIADREGGYTRILKTGNRLGDNADMCLIELVDFNESRTAETKPAASEGKKRTRRSRSKVGSEEKSPKNKAEKDVIEDAKIVDEIKDEKSTKNKVKDKPANNDSDEKN